MPILENFLFEITPGQLTITASDLQTTCITTLPVEAQSTASIAIPAAMLLNTLKNLPEQPITLVIDLATYSVQLVSANGKYKLAGENATDFPKVPEVEVTAELSLSEEVLKKAIAQTFFAISNDDLRPEMGGVYLSATPTATTFVATDGHKLVRYVRKDMTAANTVAVIIPRKPLHLLSNLLMASDDKLTMKLGSSHLSVAAQGVTLVTRLIDEQYPDYDNVIPAHNPHQLHTNREELLGALRRVSIYANKTFRQVRLKIMPDSLAVHAEDMDFSNEANEKLSCTYTGQELEIGFSARLLIDALNSLVAETITILLADAHTAALILPQDQEEGEDVLVLAMPVILREGGV